MTKSLTLRFDAGGEMTLITDQQVSGMEAVVQNAMVNLLTDAGTDSLFPARGTELFRTALSGGVFNFRSASHACNFAAVDTLFFSREYEVADAGDKLAEIVVEPSYLSVNRMEAQLSFESVDGRKMSFNYNI